MQEHRGNIIKIERNLITVKILQVSACAHCAEKKFCTLAESKEKEITVSETNPEAYSVGEEVQIVTQKRQVFTAVLWAYIMPLILLFIGVGVGTLLNLPEVHTALLGITAVAIYYVFLMAINKILSKSLEFKISKIQ